MSGGGGAGGGLLIRASDVSIPGTISARGGAGGDGPYIACDGGGGGGGGRVKIFHEGSLAAKKKIMLGGGAGGKYGLASHGQAGGAGALHIAKVAGQEPIKASLGKEQNDQ